MEPDWEKIIKAGSPRPGDPKLSAEDCRLLWRLATGLQAKTIVEIGAFRGTSSMVLGSVCKVTGGHLWSVECRPRKEWYENIRRFGLEEFVTLVSGYSPVVQLDLPAPPKAGMIGAGAAGPIDFLFIDGDHQVRSVLRDYYYWSCFVRIGGRIAFHDIYGPPSAKVNRAIEIILHDGSNCLKEVGRCPPARECGTIVFEKVRK